MNARSDSTIVTFTLTDEHEDIVNTVTITLTDEHEDILSAIQAATVELVRTSLASGDTPDGFKELAAQGVSQLLAAIDAEEFFDAEPTLEEGMAWLTLTALGMATCDVSGSGCSYRLRDGRSSLVAALALLD